MVATILKGLVAIGAVLSGIVGVAGGQAEMSEVTVHLPVAVAGAPVGWSPRETSVASPSPASTPVPTSTRAVAAYAGCRVSVETDSNMDGLVDYLTEWRYDSRGLPARETEYVGAGPTVRSISDHTFDDSARRLGYSVDNGGDGVLDYVETWVWLDGLRVRLEMNQGPGLDQLSMWVFEYDSLRRLIREWLDVRPDGLPERVIRYEYRGDTAQRLRSTDDFDADGRDDYWMEIDWFEGLVAEEREYDAEYSGGRQPVARTLFGYNARRLMASIVDIGVNYAGRTTFAYNAEGWLSETRSYRNRELRGGMAYSHDHLGRPLQTTNVLDRSAHHLDRPAPPFKVTYTYECG